jgi:hypothetical protein
MRNLAPMLASVLQKSRHATGCGSQLADRRKRRLQPVRCHPARPRSKAICPCTTAHTFSLPSRGGRSRTTASASALSATTGSHLSRLQANRRCEDSSARSRGARTAGTGGNEGGMWQLCQSAPERWRHSHKRGGGHPLCRSPLGRRHSATAAPRAPADDSARASSCLPYVDMDRPSSDNEMAVLLRLAVLDRPGSRPYVQPTRHGCS